MNIDRRLLQLLKEERMGRKKRMKESILHPISDPYGKIGRATRIAKYAGTGGVIGGFVGGTAKSGARYGANTVSKQWETDGKDSAGNWKAGSRGVKGRIGAITQYFTSNKH